MKIKEFERYARDVVRRIPTTNKVKKKVLADIKASLYTAYEERSLDDPVEIMGEAEVVAMELAEELPKRVGYRVPFESKTSIAGIPLVSISYDQFTLAKGIIAIGPAAIGVFSLGGVSLGLFSFGGVALGLLSFGGLSIGGLAAFGGLAIAYDVAFGGLAIANNLAVGGLAIAKDMAIGSTTIAKVMAYADHYQLPQGLGQGDVRAFRLPDQASVFKDYVKSEFPNLGYIKMKIIEMVHLFTFRS